MSDRTYAVIIPTYSEHFQCALRLLRSIRDRVTDQEKFGLYLVTGNDAEQEVMSRYVNQFAPGSTANILSFAHILRLLRFPVLPDVMDNPYGRQYHKFSYQALKKLTSAVFTQADVVLTLDAESYVYREMAVLDEIVEPYLARPRHFSFISSSPFLTQLIQGAAHCLGYNHDVLTAYNFEYQDWIFEKDLLQGFLEQITGAWAANTYFDAIYRAFFAREATGPAFFEIMAYRYYLERQQLAGNPRLTHYEFVDSFDAFAQCMLDPELAAARPKDHPIEHLGRWLTPLTYAGIRQFIQRNNIRMMRLERDYPQPWLVRKLIDETPELKMFVCSQDYELYI